ncbi:pseudouridine synthase [Thalassotalea sp. ND16A]|uniref:pseudouridine synthase n=1 Tax=Thalassotalea sp. ND16A TaxID=1535422 RepID=UPI00051A613D|nr:pseudouridine synthase [Thalassotalea sp. ND16A]KGJ89473.1 hypothetical protein ND16A_2366 [Thalassotalea sp. ND16A]
MQRSRLDRFISLTLNISRRDVRLMLAQKRITVDGIIVSDIGLIIDKFSLIVVDDKVLQNYQPSYVMVHKPVGVVSATTDEQHKTVIDLLDSEQYPEKTELHIVGRLDLNTSGLILLTNDSSWSERLTQPNAKVAKHYKVTLADAISEDLQHDYVSAFAKGMYFAYEDITTKAAKLTIISPHTAVLTLTEGRYHQIKRMFGRFQNKVVALHRFAIGNLELEQQLLVGTARRLTACEVRQISVK